MHLSLPTSSQSSVQLSCSSTWVHLPQLHLLLFSDTDRKLRYVLQPEAYMAALVPVAAEATVLQREWLSAGCGLQTLLEVAE